MSRLEQRLDLLRSTLASYVNAMGGKLRLLVEFPDRPPVPIASLADVASKTDVPSKQRLKPARETKATITENR